MNSKLQAGITESLIAGAALLWTIAAQAHAFPQDSKPGVGAVLHEAPKQVWIQFDSRLEQAFSVIVVKDSNGNKISGKTKLDPASQQALEVSLPALAPGDYHVYWNVVSWDGHRTKGDYTFSIVP
jgi:methionine-rich copper-binding protein CopC